MTLGSILRAIGRSLLRHPAYKVLSLGIAVVAWLYVQGGQVVEAKVRVRLVWQLPDALLNLEPLPASATLTLFGPRNAGRRAASEDVYVPIDLTQHTVGEVDLDFGSLPVVGLPSNLQIRRIEPESVRFVLDEVSAKKVKVEPRLIGDPAEDYQILSVEARPPVVSIRGPRAVIEGITDLATMPMDISGLADDAVQRVELDLPRSVALVTDETIRLVVDVEPRITERRFADVPVQVWRGEAWRTEPEVVEVVLAGPTAQLASVSAEDVIVFLHLPETPVRPSYSALFGSVVGPRLRVLHGGGGEVRALSVEPPAVTAVKR